MITFSPPLGTFSTFMLAGLVVILGVLWSLYFLESRRLFRLRAFASAEALERLLRGHAPAWRRPLNLFVMAGVSLLILALAGPQWGTTDTGRGRASREVVILLDTSESMNAIDPAPNRLDRARRKITELLLRHSADRFGLIVFSGGATLQCPLTNDHAYFKTILQTVDTDTLSEEGTDIESAFQSAELLFNGTTEREATVGRAGRVVILISDGEEVTGDALAAVERLRASSHVMVMGIGNPEGVEITMPSWMNRGAAFRPQSVVHWSQLDEKRLADIAVAGDGVYVRSTLGDEDLNVIDRELAFLSGGLGGDTPGHRRVNRFRWPLAIAALFFVLEGVWLVLLPHFGKEIDAAAVEGLPS